VYLNTDLESALDEVTGDLQALAIVLGGWVLMENLSDSKRPVDLDAIILDTLDNLGQLNFVRKLGDFVNAVVGFLDGQEGSCVSTSQYWTEDIYACVLNQFTSGVSDLGHVEARSSVEDRR
jgi:hypothetical protein